MPETTTSPLRRGRTALSLLALGLLASGAWAQGPIWRCGNEYTNTPGDPQARGCRLVEGGNLTIVQGVRPVPATTPAAAAGAGSSPATRPAGDAAQRERDRDARLILEAELRKAEERLQTLQAESRQPAGAQAPDLKARLERATADVAAIRRELERAAAPR